MEVCWVPDSVWFNQVQITDVPELVPVHLWLDHTTINFMSVVVMSYLRWHNSIQCIVNWPPTNRWFREGNTQTDTYLETCSNTQTDTYLGTCSNTQTDTYLWTCSKDIRSWWMECSRPHYVIVSYKHQLICTARAINRVANCLKFFWTVWKLLVLSRKRRLVFPDNTMSEKQ